MTSLSERSESRISGRVPPHSVEAEESVLGSMLLSVDALNEVMDKLEPDDFYVPAHQSIFEAIRNLFNANQAIDAITVSEELRRVGQLERIGGVGYVTNLLDIVPTASNILYYSGIVEEHSQRRALIRAGSGITDLAFRLDDEIANVLDRAEQSVLGVAGRKVGDGILPIGPLFFATLEELEALEARGSEVTGLSTGFRDLDRKLTGLHPANLVIVAARPAMGKSAITANIATNVAMERRAVAFFSLEMSKEEVAQRMLCSVARIDSMKLRTGQIGEAAWPRLTDAAGRLYDAPIYVDDSPVVTVTDIRAKCRRLKRKHGLDLVVVDYMQLMQGSMRENRQQEIADISRSLKNLARELEVPIIAVSQLNRNLESREDKRPRLGDLRESGCLTAETILVRADTNEAVALGELVQQGVEGVPVWSIDEHYRLVPGTISRAFSTGVKQTFELRFASGARITASANHPFLTVSGWKRVDQLSRGEHLATARRLPTPDRPSSMEDSKIVLLAHLIGGGCHLERHAPQYTTTDILNVEVVRWAAGSAFGIDVRSRRERNGFQVNLSGSERLGHGRRNPICAWLDGLGLVGRRPWEKFVPRELFSLRPRQIALFLHHLWATGGTIHRRASGQVSIVYATTSEPLARGVIDLLLRLGIPSRLSRVKERGRRDRWDVRVGGREQQLAFLDLVGCAGSRGERIPELRDEIAERIGNPHADVIPSETWGYVRTKAMETAGVSGRELARRLGMSHCGSTLYRSGISRERAGRLAEALDDPLLRDLATSDVLWDRLVSIEPRGPQEVFDVTVPGPHNFLANGIVAHNSLEQDADIVIFIYRDEYYNEGTDKKGIAEVIVAKHRAGSTGTVDMTFMPEFTKFSDLGRD